MGLFVFLGSRPFFDSVLSLLADSQIQLASRVGLQRGIVAKAFRVTLSVFITTLFVPFLSVLPAPTGIINLVSSILDSVLAEAKIGSAVSSLLFYGKYATHWPLPPFVYWPYGCQPGFAKPSIICSHVCGAPCCCHGCVVHGCTGAPPCGC
eukprot:5255390-Heterocapsa_arctica.AAC.1